MRDLDRPITPQEAYDGDYWRKRSWLTFVQAKRATDSARDDLLAAALAYRKLAGRADRLQIEIRKMADSPDEASGF